MSRRNPSGSKWFLLAGAALTLALLSSAPAVSASAGSDVAFRTSIDPGKVILFVEEEWASTGDRTSMSLYGDGRLEVTHGVVGGAAPVSRSRQLTAGAAEELVRLVVEYGLAEYDAPTIEARLRSRVGDVIPISSDGPLVAVLVSLEELRRGGQVRAPLFTRIQLSSPRLLAKSFPDFSEFEGLVRLMDYMHEALSQGEG
ncbi:MAG: hypothetical protein AMXMBFR36_16730 [Acidobacteriota bacterium]